MYKCTFCQKQNANNIRYPQDGKEGKRKLKNLLKILHLVLAYKK